MHPKEFVVLIDKKFSKNNKKYISIHITKENGVEFFNLYGNPTSPKSVLLYEGELNINK